MKKLLAVITFCLMLIGVVFPAAIFAQDTSSSYYLYDEANVLSQDERQALEAKLSESSAKYDTFVAAVLTNNTGINPNDNNYDYLLQDYSDEYLRNLVSKSGKNDAILLTIDVYGRGYHISTSGQTIYAFTDYGISRMGEELTTPLRNSDWNEAVALYADLAGGMIDYKNNNGMAYGQTEETVADDQSEDRHLPAKGFIGVIAGILGSLGITNGMKRKLKTVEQKTNASDYFNLNNLRLRAQKDTFLYMNVSRVPIRTEPPKGSGGGGFTTHTSSGGGTFGGGGGRF